MRRPGYNCILIAFGFFLFISCQENHAAIEKQIVTVPQEMDPQISENIKQVLQYALENKGKINDTIKLGLPTILDSFYRQGNYKNIWSNEEKWEPLADSLFNFIKGAELYGLFPNDYHYTHLASIRKLFMNDSLARMDANIWTQAELMMTDAFMQVTKHLKQGRLVPDSLSMIADSSVTNEFFIKNLYSAIENKTLLPLLHSLEPKHKGYADLKKGIKNFVDSMDRKKYTYVQYPYKDSLAFIRILQKRLQEGGYMDRAVTRADSATLANSLKSYQKKKGLKVDGKFGQEVVRSLNSTDLEKFKRIAINIDRFKQLPERMPQRYIWVNLPGYYLRVFDHDTLVFESKTIVGKPSTRTPELNSEISDMVTYPQWTIPTSIIKKDILPGMKRNIEYLRRKGFHLVDMKGDQVDPYSVNWAKYTKGIPYKVVQGSGDGNALGVLKFNFENPFSVYLHDTNQRYLFKNSSRALSHGCVRVQEWSKLAFYIAAIDSVNKIPGNPPQYNSDSIRTWLANKERKRIMVKNRIPLYIRYFTCEGKNGKMLFYEDIYSEDKLLRDKYFASK
jgi:murein L,D-transpeptidase YcbB/YkuD